MFRLCLPQVILCGEYGVGKSSLFRRFAQNSFVASSDRASTLGLDHFDKVYKVTGREIKVKQHNSILVFYRLLHSCQALLGRTSIIQMAWVKKTIFFFVSNTSGTLLVLE